MFRHVHTTAGHWREAARVAVTALGSLPAPDVLAFLYVSDRFATEMDDLLDYLRRHTGIQHWVGTVGMGLCSAGQESYEEGGMVLLVTDIPDSQFQLIPNLTTRVDRFLDSNIAWRRQAGAHFGVVHGDPTNAETPTLIESLANGMDPGFLVGGLSSSETTLPQLCDRVVSGGISGVMFASTVEVTTGLSQGCSLIGRRHEVTEGERNIILKIDDRPAMDVFEEEIGEVLARDLSRVGGFIFAALPIAGSDTGDYLVRNLVGVDPENRILAIGDYVRPGMPIQFARRDGQTAREDLIRMLEDTRARAGKRVRGGLYFSCLGRGRQLFGEESAEMRLVQHYLSDIPLAGFYANGEIFHNRLYGYTGVLTLFH